LSQYLRILYDKEHTNLRYEHIYYSYTEPNNPLKTTPNGNNITMALTRSNSFRFQQNRTL